MVEQLLMMGEIEPNPGPPEKICYEGWAGMHPSSYGQVLALLICPYQDLWSNPCTKGGSIVFVGVNPVLSKTNEELKDQYYPNHSG